MSNFAIEVKDLVKTYRKATVNAVDHVSFTVDEGEFFAFLGPNGAGKTTTISILTTTLSKTAGEITIAGHDTEKEASAVRQAVGIIFQNPSLDLNLTAEENIRFHALLYGLYGYRPFYRLMAKEYRDRVSQLAEILGIQNEIHKPVKTFSGGMKRKLEILRSLMHKPQILFLDEPTTGLDPQSRRNLWEYIQDVRKQYGTTVFLTTHYLDEAEGVDRVAVINKGKLVVNDSPTNLKSALVNEYVSFVAENAFAIAKDLAESNYEYTAEGESHFTINITGRNVQHLIQSIKTPISKIEVHQPTLEEAYLEVINKDYRQENITE